MIYRQTGNHYIPNMHMMDLDLFYYGQIDQYYDGGYTACDVA